MYRASIYTYDALQPGFNDTQNGYLKIHLDEAYVLTSLSFISFAQMIMLEHNERRRKADDLRLFDIILTSGGYIMKIRFGMFVTGVLGMLLSCPGNGCAQGLSIVFIRCIRA